MRTYIFKGKKEVSFRGGVPCQNHYNGFFDDTEYFHSVSFCVMHLALLMWCGKEAIGQGVGKVLGPVYPLTLWVKLNSNLSSLGFNLFVQ